MLPLVHGQEVGSGRIEPAEVKEHQGSPVYQHRFSLSGQRALSNVPVGHVAGRVANHVVRKTVDEVNPPLICEHHVGVVDQTVALKALPPELQESTLDSTDPGSDEAEVVSARSQEVGFGGRLAVTGQWLEVMRGDHHTVQRAEIRKVSHPSENLDVGIKIQHRLVGFFQEMRE